MKKLLFIFFMIFSTTFAIVDFDGLNWGSNPKNLNLFFKNVKKISTSKEYEILEANETKKNDVLKYEFYYKNNGLYKIRVVFNKLNVSDVRNVYASLEKKFGKPIARNGINERENGMKLVGNKIVFKPDLTTSVEYIGVDTINEKNQMVDSNLYLDYIGNSIIK